MGIRKQVFYIAVCDECDAELENGEGGVLCLLTKEDAENHISYADWVKKDGKLLCDNCYASL